MRLIHADCCAERRLSNWDCAQRIIAFLTGSYASNQHHWTENATTAAKVHVGNTNVTLSPTQPDPGHTISGAIRNSANQGVHNATVSLEGDTSYAYTSTDAQGNFSFFGVGSGTHTIYESASASGQNLRRGYYYSGAPSHWTADEDQASALSANVNHPGVVIKPATGYSFSGRITNATHDGVVSYVTVGGSGFAFTDDQGNYIMNCLDPGDYAVEVSPGSSATAHYRGGYYSKSAPGHFVASYVDATTVHVGP